MGIKSLIDALRSFKLLRSLYPDEKGPHLGYLICINNLSTASLARVIGVERHKFIRWLYGHATIPKRKLPRVANLINLIEESEAKGLLPLKEISCTETTAFVTPQLPRIFR